MKINSRSLNQSFTALFRNNVIFIMLFSLFSFGSTPTPKDIDLRIKQIKDSDYKQTVTTDEAIKIVKECYEDSKKINYEDGIRSSGIFLTMLYSNKLDYNNSIRISNEIEGLMDRSTDYRNVVEYYKARGYCYILLGLFKESRTEYFKSLKAVEKISNNDDRNYMKSVIYTDLYFYLRRDDTKKEDSALIYLKKSLSFAEKISKNGDLAKKGERIEWIINLNYLLGNFFVDKGASGFDKSRTYYTHARELYENSETKMLLGNEIALLSYLCNFYYLDKNYDESIKCGLRSLELQKKDSFPQFKKIVYEFIARSYLEIGENKNYQKFMNKYISISDSLALSERNRASASLETIIEKKDQFYTKKYSFMLQLSAVILTIIIIFSILFWKQKSKKIHRNYLAVIERIKNDKNSEPLVQTPYNERTNTFNIPEETYQKILVKMQKFEKNLGFLKKDITISYLSNQFKTNPKSLSSVINSSTGKNFNTYLNDLRINYITQKLYDDRIYREFKINYLAEECGFSSSKVFLAAFKKTTGVTPSYYITNLKKDLEDGK